MVSVPPEPRHKPRKVQYHTCDTAMYNKNWWANKLCFSKSQHSFCFHWLHQENHHMHQIWMSDLNFLVEDICLAASCTIHTHDRSQRTATELQDLLSVWRPLYKSSGNVLLHSLGKPAQSRARNTREQKLQ